MKLSLFYFIFLSAFLALAEPYEKYYVQYDGPNCLNSALYQNQITPFHHYTSNAEMIHILTSEACHKLTPNDALALNDIGVIFSTSKLALKEVISHAFVVIDGNRLFEKHGYSKAEAYQFTDLTTVFSEYSIPDSARVEYYRCQNFANTLQKNLKTTQAINHFQKLIEIQTQLNSFIFESKQLQRLPELHLQIQMLANSALQSKLPEFLNFLIATRLVSISGQLNALGFSQARMLVWPSELILKNPSDVYEALTELEN